MVTMLKGTLGGNEIIFTRADGDIWEARVPMMESGEYIVALYAEDEAGNSAYMATILYVVDVAGLCFHIEFIDFSVAAEELMGRVAYFVKDVQE